MNIVQTQLARIHILLGKINRKAYKADYVIDITNGREISSSKLTFDEANALIKLLENEELVKFADDYNSTTFSDEKMNRLRRKILSICHELGWYKIGADGKLILKDGKQQLDFDRINNYCLKYGHYHKPLNNHTGDELQGKTGLIFQFQTMLDNHRKAIK